MGIPSHLIHHRKPKAETQGIEIWDEDDDLDVSCFGQRSGVCDELFDDALDGIDLSEPTLFDPVILGNAAPAAAHNDDMSSLSAFNNSSEFDPQRDIEPVVMVHPTPTAWQSNSQYSFAQGASQQSLLVKPRVNSSISQSSSFSSLSNLGRRYIQSPVPSSNASIVGSESDEEGFDDIDFPSEHQDLLLHVNSRHVQPLILQQHAANHTIHTTKDSKTSTDSTQYSTNESSKLGVNNSDSKADDFDDMMELEIPDGNDSFLGLIQSRLAKYSQQEDHKPFDPPCQTKEITGRQQTESYLTPFSMRSSMQSVQESSKPGKKEVKTTAASSVKSSPKMSASTKHTSKSTSSQDLNQPKRHQIQHHPAPPSSRPQIASTMSIRRASSRQQLASIANESIRPHPPPSPRVQAAPSTSTPSSKPIQLQSTLMRHTFASKAKMLRKPKSTGHEGDGTELDSIDDFTTPYPTKRTQSPAVTRNPIKPAPHTSNTYSMSNDRGGRYERINSSASSAFTPRQMSLNRPGSGSALNGSGNSSNKHTSSLRPAYPSRHNYGRPISSFGN